MPALVTAIVLVVCLEAVEDNRSGRGRCSAGRRALLLHGRRFSSGSSRSSCTRSRSAASHPRMRSLGGYSVLTTSTYSAKAVSRWFVYHLGELDLAVGILPLAAFLLLLFVAVRPRPFHAQARVFAVVSLSAAVWLSSRSEPSLRALSDGRFRSAMSSTWSPCSLSRWPRGRLARCPLLRVRPQSRRLSPRPSSALSLSPLSLTPERSRTRSVSCRYADRAARQVASGQLELVIVLAAVCAGLLFLLLPRRFLLVAPALVLVYLASATSPVEGLTSQASHDSRVGGVQAPRTWIDNTVGTRPDVAAIWTGATGVNFVALWDNEFFNRSVGPVYNINGPPDGLPQQTIVVDPASASLHHADGTPVRAKYVLVDRSMTIAGRALAGDPGTGMTLYRVDNPVRLVGATAGIYPDHWSGPSVQYTRYPCTRGTSDRHPRRLPPAPAAYGHGRGHGFQRHARTGRGQAGRHSATQRGPLA